MRRELEDILLYWMTHAPDLVNGGFYGSISNNNQVALQAPRGAVLNSRILWSFSAAFNLTLDDKYLRTAARAYGYIRDHFIDQTYGGVYWTVDCLGRPLDEKKQIYALAFTIYGLSEYHLATGDDTAMALAINLYEVIMSKGFDPVHGGYLEAFTRDWQEMPDVRLSNKDANESKSMNTHLHVLEAFASLYRVWPNADLRKNITELVGYFLDHIIDPVSYHLHLFFDDQWNRRSDTISYGHDIEAAWLIQEAAGIIGDEELLTKVKAVSVKIADAAAAGLDTDGGLWYEFEPASGQRVTEKHWWPQAEAMVGFFNAFQLTGDESYLQKSLRSWSFVKNHLRDLADGEWYWGVDENYRVMPGQDKVGLWKCPYHNSRACIEVIRRISNQL